MRSLCGFSAGPLVMEREGTDAYAHQASVASRMADASNAMPLRWALTPEAHVSQPRPGMAGH